MAARPVRPGEYTAVVFDLDGTLTREVNSWAAVQRRLSPALHERARERWRRYREGQVTRAAFLADQIADLAGQDGGLLDEVVATIEYHDGVADACASLRAAGLRLGIVSAGVSLLAERVAGELGIHLHRANVVHRADGLFTGSADITVPPGGKEPAFLDLVAELGVAADSVVAVGDSGGDVDMFRLAGLGVAFCPVSADVRAAADVVIDLPDMRELLPWVLRR
jgi:phosphoserine phosphatase